ncbi:MAG: hypothetical protein HJJLKODD_00158 [Phycisphaerae bacterium]|nr:hypothetical protein [Phycisphaerae bacterium]
MAPAALAADGFFLVDMRTDIATAGQFLGFIVDRACQPIADLWDFTLGEPLFRTAPLVWVSQAATSTLCSLSCRATAI